MNKDEAVEGLKQKIENSMQAWFDIWSELVPAGPYDEPMESFSHSQRQHVLRFPSDFSLATLEDSGLKRLALIELKLRTGQAYDALKRIRDFLGLKSFMIRDKRGTGRGGTQNTRSETQISRTQTQVVKWVKVYRRNYERIQKLVGACDVDEPLQEKISRLRLLQDRDLVMLSTWMEEHRNRLNIGELEQARLQRQGIDHVTIPWIWKMARVDSDDGSIEDSAEEGKQ